MFGGLSGVFEGLFEVFRGLAGMFKGFFEVFEGLAGVLGGLAEIFKSWRFGVGYFWGVWEIVEGFGGN